MREYVEGLWVGVAAMRSWLPTCTLVPGVECVRGGGGVRGGGCFCVSVCCSARVVCGCRYCEVLRCAFTLKQLTELVT